MGQRDAIYAGQPEAIINTSAAHSEALRDVDTRTEQLLNPTDWLDSEGVALLADSGHRDLRRLRRWCRPDRP